jgi:hypothetical protein
MRIRRRYAILVAVAATAFAAFGAAGVAQANNVSSLPTWNVTPSALPGNGTGGNPAFANVQLNVRTHTNYTSPGNKPAGGFAKTVTVMYDNDGAINLTGIPRCTATFGGSTTIAQAWERCGPGADTAPEVNAYLSPPGAVSGRVSTAPASNFPGCTLVFNGPLQNGNPTTILFSRITLIANGTANCANPATNSSGNTSVTLKGTITNAGVADFGKKLTVPNIDLQPLPLDDFTASVRRGNVFTSRCFDTNRILNIRGIFRYSGTGEPTDTVNSTQQCTVQN